jgi:hypothetical protein
MAAEEEETTGFWLLGFTTAFFFDSAGLGHATGGGLTGLGVGVMATASASEWLEDSALNSGGFNFLCCSLCNQVSGILGRVRLQLSTVSSAGSSFSSFIVSTFTWL